MTNLLAIWVGGHFARGFSAPACIAGASIMEFGEAIKNPAYRIFQTEYSGCLDISAHA